MSHQVLRLPSKSPKFSLSSWVPVNASCPLCSSVLISIPSEHHLPPFCCQCSCKSLKPHPMPKTSRSHLCIKPSPSSANSWTQDSSPSGSASAYLSNLISALPSCSVMVNAATSLPPRCVFSHAVTLPIPLLPSSPAVSSFKTQLKLLLPSLISILQRSAPPNPQDEVGLLSWCPFNVSILAPSPCITTLNLLSVSPVKSWIFEGKAVAQFPDSWAPNMYLRDSKC